MKCRKRGLGPFSALGRYIALSCLLHGLLIAVSSLPVPFSGGWHKRIGPEFDYEVRPRALTVTMATLGSNIPPRPSISTKKLRSASPRPRMAEAEPLPPVETNPPPRQRVYQDFELDIQASPELPLELDETLVPPENEQGKIQLLLLVAATGEVLWAYVEATELSPETTETLAERFRKTRFLPGQVNQQAVDSLYRIEVSLASATPRP